MEHIYEHCYLINKQEKFKSGNKINIILNRSVHVYKIIKSSYIYIGKFVLESHHYSQIIWPQKGKV